MTRNRFLMGARLPTTIALVLLCLNHAPATIRYVSLSSTNPVPPYTNWSTAATNIQDAVDASTNGDLVLVTNGVYRTGGRVIYGAMTNRAAVDKPITVQSVNGAAFTTIEGKQLPGVTNGDGAIRCCYLTNGASIVGFTITNGATRATGDGNQEESGGGIWCVSNGAIISNCWIIANASCHEGGGVYFGTLKNCVLMNNSAPYGGAVYSSITINCALAQNLGIYGGACNYGELTNCTITGNWAMQGGGTYSSTVANCLVYHNTALFGSNYQEGKFNYSCTAPLPPGTSNFSGDPQLTDLYHISSNSPCRAAGNTAWATGTDIDGATWLNPPSIGCDEYHIGSRLGQLYLSIQTPFTNTIAGTALQFCANIKGLSAASVWNFGDGETATNQAYVSHAWTTQGDYPVLLCAYNDAYPGGITATTLVHVVVQPVHYVAAGNSTPIPPYASWETAATNIQDAVDAATAAGALVLVSNGVYGTGGRVVYGTRTNRLAVTKPITVQSVSGPSVTAIQGYQVPGTTTGQGAIRCAYLSGGATLTGFTLTNGATGDTASTWFLDEELGGGVWCDSSSAVVSNCVLIANAAFDYGGGSSYGTFNYCTFASNNASVGGGTYFGVVNNCVLEGNQATEGGGTYFGLLNNCVLTGNSASTTGGGGAYDSTLINCTVVGNAATGWQGVGGGANYCWLTNCILYDNVAYYPPGPGASNYAGGTLSYCCTAPMPASGIGNLVDVPRLADEANGDFHLLASSPCINSGKNAPVTLSTDLDGNPRIVAGTVDIGAYEFQDPRSVISYAWLEQYGLPTDGSADFVDSDGNGMNNWEKWIAGLNPTNAHSVLALLPPFTSGSGLEITWQSVSNRLYFLQRCTNLNVPLVFSTIQTNIQGQTSTTSFIDTTAIGGGPYFYRVGVQQ